MPAAPNIDDLLRLKAIIENPTARIASLLLALSQLEAFGTLDLELLAATKIGRSLAELASSSREAFVTSKAQKLVQEWRANFRKRKADSEPSEAKDNRNSPPKNIEIDKPGHNAEQRPRKQKRSEVDSPAAAEENDPRKHLDVKLSIKSKGEETTTVSEEQRRRVHSSLSAVLGNALAGNVEAALHRSLGNGSYVAQARSILFNLKDPKNQYFKKLVLSGSIRPADLPFLTSEQMSSEEKHEQRTLIRKLSLEEVQADWERRHATIGEGMFTCPNCQSRKTSYQQLQSGLGLDEPMTTYVSCFECGNRWKFDDVGASADADG
jgi:transcription elongation factor S-II